MGSYKKHTLFTIYDNLTKCINSVCLEMQLFWIVEILVVFEADRVADTVPGDTVYCSTPVVGSAISETFEDLWYNLAEYRNNFAHRGLQSAYSPFCYLKKRLNEVRDLLESYHIIIGDFNEPMFYTKENEALYK